MRHNETEQLTNIWVKYLEMLPNYMTTGRGEVVGIIIGPYNSRYLNPEGFEYEQMEDMCD